MATLVCNVVTSVFMVFTSVDNPVTVVSKVPTWVVRAATFALAVLTSVVSVATSVLMVFTSVDNPVKVVSNVPT